MGSCQLRPFYQSIPIEYGNLPAGGTSICPFQWFGLPFLSPTKNQIFCARVFPRVFPGIFLHVFSQAISRIILIRLFLFQKRTGDSRIRTLDLEISRMSWDWRPRPLDHHGLVNKTLFIWSIFKNIIKREICVILFYTNLGFIKEIHSISFNLQLII